MPPSAYVFIYIIHRSAPIHHCSLQVFTPKAAALFVLTGAALFLYFRNEKEKLLEQRRASSHSPNPIPNL